MTMHPKPDTATGQRPLCEICKEPVEDETWIDDEEYGDVHERCLDEVRP